MAESRQISEGILLAAASALSYGIAFAYQSGYASYFGMPPLLLTPTIGTVLKAAGAVGLAFLSFWNIANGIWPFAPRGESALHKAIRRLLAITLIAGLVAFNLLDGWRAWIALASVVSFFAFFELAFPLIVHRKVVGYENKLLAQKDLERNSQKYTLTEKAAGVMGESGLRLAAAALLLLLLANIVGNNAARNQEEFYVVATPPNAVVLSMENNILILGTYDPKTMTLSGTYLIEQLSDSHHWSLEKQRIGKLKEPPKPQVTAKTQ